MAYKVHGKGITTVKMKISSKTKTDESGKEYRIAIGAQSNDHSAYLAGVSTTRFFTEAPTFAHIQVLVSHYYRFDTLSNFWDVYNIEAEALGQKIVYHPGGIPDSDRSQPLIKTPSDLDRISPPDPYRSGRMPWVIQINKHFQEVTGKLERVYFTAPFSIAANIRGYENLVMDMYDNPSFVHRLLKFLCDDVLVPYIEVLKNEIGNPDLILDGRDAWASPPMITLDMMDEYVVTYTKRLRDKLGDNLITRGNWGDARSGDLERFFSQKLKCSPGSLSVLDPDLHEIEPERVETFAEKNRASIIAGVDANLLKNGPVDSIVNRIKHYIHSFARDGQCMIHLNQIPANTPPEHIHAAVEACHTYGKLPIPRDLEDVAFTVPNRESFLEFLGKNGKQTAVKGCLFGS